MSEPPLVKKKSEYEVVGDLGSLREKSPVQSGQFLVYLIENWALE